MLTPDEFDPEIVAEPIILREEAATPRLVGPRGKAASYDSVAVWGVVILAGLVVMAYAVMKASRSAPSPATAPAPERIVVADPEPRPAPKPHATPRRSRPAPAPAKSATAAPVVVNHVEPEKKAVDPIEGFDSGEAFDNPTSPGRYGQRTSGLLERSPAPARPNTPDPSFGRDPK